MKVTLFDEQGVELTEITSHVGRSPGQMVVDWATRPDALFQYYFGGRHTVTLVNNVERYSAVLNTRWLMGARSWFLHTFQSTGVSDTPRFRALRAADLDAPAVARTSEPRGVAA